jgi:hypothetical protein
MNVDMDVDFDRDGDGDLAARSLTNRPSRRRASVYVHDAVAVKVHV